MTVIIRVVDPASEPNKVILQFRLQKTQLDSGLKQGQTVHGSKIDKDTKRQTIRHFRQNLNK